MLNGEVCGGVVIIPSKPMARFLTDRIGNAPELLQYYPLWQSWASRYPEFGYLGIVIVEHDMESLDAPRIPKMTDGRARI